MVCESVWRKMERQQGSRVDLAELKTQIVKRIGVEKSRKYLNCLSRFLNLEFAKSEFDKWCLRLLGRENLPLHNLLIRSILKNACQAKTAPLAHEVGRCKPSVEAVKCSPTKEDQPENNGFLFRIQNQIVPNSSNGVLLASPRKARSVIRDRKFRDRSNLPGPNGKVRWLPHQQMASQENGGNISLQNGKLNHSDYQRLVHYDDEMDGLAHYSGKESSRPNKDQGETNVDQEEDQARLNLFKTPLLAPLGIPVYKPNVPASRKTEVLNNSNFTTCYGTGGSYDSEMLRTRMENIAAVQGLEGVSGECANALNSILDDYLKRLIKSSIDLVGARSNGPKAQTIDKQQTQGKITNGMWPGNSHRQRTGGVAHDHKSDQLSVSLLDFRVAMESNPHQLGEHWPLLLERICMRSFEE